MSSAAISTAVTGPVGSPSASMGTNAPVEAALLADSGPATPATAPLPNSSGMFGNAPFDRIGQKTGNDVSGAWNDADQKAEHRTARDRHHRLPPFLAAGQQLAQPRTDHLVRHLAARRGQNLAEAEQADRHRHDAEPVAKLGNVEAVAEVPGHHVDADGAEQHARTPPSAACGRASWSTCRREKQGRAPAARCIPEGRSVRRRWRAAERSASAR